ncbi:MAG TPA: hypothetical protein VNW95_00810 [Mucilaginibacter sp.]|jgi:hypothetical protein|nr:hypothetical protein [Mucilaginibacter sp.]
MKKLLIISAIAISGLVCKTADAQVGVHVGLNFGTPVYPRHRVVVEEPVYTEPAPVVYNDYNDYYYLPDVDAYYSVGRQCYYYNNGYNWVATAYLPGVYRDYDWRSMRRYEVRAPRPYLHDDIYRTRYSGHEMREWNRPVYDRRYENYPQERRFNNEERGEHFEHREHGERHHDRGDD